MANFVLVLDANTDRRSRFIQVTRPKIAPVPNLSISTQHLGDLSVQWAISPRAPISTHRTDTNLSIIWGEAIAPGSSDRITAQRLQYTWRTPPGIPYDGYYAAFTHSSETGLILGTDVLGVFPIYYFQHPEVLLVGSSPALFQYHPCCHPSLSLEGLIGFLNLKQLCSNQTLWQGVRRLDAGHSLIATSPKEATTVVQYKIPCFQQDIETSGYQDLSFTEHLEILYQTLDRAVERHFSPKEKVTLLLSGGLDSRMMAGFLQRHNIPVHALTWGRRGDFEYQCAVPVAKALKADHEIHEISQKQQFSLAEFVLDWEHLAAGGNGMTGSVWGFSESLNHLPAPITSGLLLDVIIGGLYSTTSVNMAKNPCFEVALENIVKSGGLTIDQIKQLFYSSAEFDGALCEFTDSLRSYYNQYSDREDRRTWLFTLFHNHRMRLGANLWRMSFSNWPRLIVLDQQVIATSVQIPFESTNNRRLQAALVKQYFPHLARIPIDHNSFDIAPLGAYESQGLVRTFKQIQKITWKVQYKLGHERRRYYRVYNINSPVFKVLRRQANANRVILENWLNLDVLENFFPSNGRISFQRDPISETRKYLLLLSLLLWVEGNL